MKLPLNVPQHFFDDELIAAQQRLVRRWPPATVFPEPVIRPDRPWEGRMLGLHGTALPDPEGGFRLYYSSVTPRLAPFTKALLAMSRDGFRWEKPELGLVEWEGSASNNITFAADRHSDSFSVAYNPEDAEFPYKASIFQTGEIHDPREPDWGLYGYLSRDGLKWEPIPGVRLKAGDRTTMMSAKSRGKFVVYCRHPEMWEQVGARAIYRSESEDFLRWTEPELALAPDLADEPDVEFYAMSVFERNGWYLGLLEYWDRSTDIMGTHLAVSRDGKAWIRPTPRQEFIPRNLYWNSAACNCASGAPIIINEQMVFYFRGGTVCHNYDSAQLFGAIGYASLPLDRFCAIEGSTGGQMTTIELEWPGGDLALNADTREYYTSHPMCADGQIAVEVLDANVSPIPDWSGDNQAVFQGNTHCRCKVFGGIVRWPNDRSLGELKGKSIRLHFRLKHARLYTFEARESPHSD